MRMLRNLALSLGFIGALAAYTGCSDDDNQNNNNGSNPVAAFNTGSISPADNSVFDGPVDLSFTVPPVDESYAGSLEGSVEATGDNGTPSDTSDDSTATVFSDSVTPGQGITVPLNPDTLFGRGLVDGERLTLDILVEATDAPAPNSQSARVRLTYEGPTQKPVRVTRCNVNGSYVNSSLAIGCFCDSDNGPVTGWNLTGGASGATIFPNGNIGTQNILGASDVGLHTYNVTCTDGTVTSDVYTFTVPVDEHLSTLVLKCQGGNNETLRLPETSVDTVASQCGAGFNAALKPAANSQPDYTLDVDFACVPGAIESLTPAERQSHENYNNGKIVSDVYSNCTVDFAQVSYHHQ